MPKSRFMFGNSLHLVHSGSSRDQASSCKDASCVVPRSNYMALWPSIASAACHLKSTIPKPSGWGTSQQTPYAVVGALCIVCKAAFFRRARFLTQIALTDSLTDFHWLTSLRCAKVGGGCPAAAPRSLPRGGGWRWFQPSGHSQEPASLYLAMGISIPTKTD